MTEPYVDAGGRLCLLVGEKVYYLSTPGQQLYCSVDAVWTDKAGRTWRTPHRRKVKNERIRQQLLAAKGGRS